MARCLPKDGYFQFIDMMYRNQDKWDPDGYNIPDIHRRADRHGPRGRDERRPGRHMHLQTRRTAEDRRHRRSMPSKTYGINSTPSFLIDGKFHQQDVVTWEGLQKVLDAELKSVAKQS